MALATNPSDDVLFYVGMHRHPYHVNFDSLSRSSAYFKHLLDAAPHMRAHPILIDCEESIFESLLLLIRYGTLEALPPMSTSEVFRLKKEADFYGIRYTEPCFHKRETSHSDDGSSEVSCSSPASSSQSGSPKSMMHMSPPPASKRRLLGRHYEGIRVEGTTPPQLAELPEFSADLADPSRLLLVSCLDQEKASIYTCGCVSSTGRPSATQWAINFSHRHAFCTACGCTPNLSPKHFAEMFMAAAANYLAQTASPGQTAPMKGAWRVISDSTCVLRFVSSAGDGADACACSAGGRSVGKGAQPTIWAANYFYSHAFCTCCGEVAKGPVLLSLLLAIRYGGRKMSRSSSRADSHTSSPHGQPTKNLLESSLKGS